MTQQTLFSEPTECQHTSITDDRTPWAGWQPGELTRHCDFCWHWINADGNAPAIEEIR